MEQQRAAFEVWYQRHYPTATPSSYSKINGRYVDVEVSVAWEAWQAALAEPAAEPVAKGNPPEGVDLIVKDKNYGPWIARWNNHLKVFTVAQPCEVDCLPAGCDWWHMPYNQPQPAVPEVPTTAEQKLAKAGVFKGATGLRKLSQAREFWEKQPYGTRLYYGPQADDYLHRGVLEAAVRIMDAQPQPAAPEPKA